MVGPEPDIDLSMKIMVCEHFYKSYQGGVTIHLIDAPDKQDKILKTEY